MNQMSHDQSIETLKSEQHRLKTENAALRNQRATRNLPPELEADVKQRIAAGLSEADAINLAMSQIEHDRNLARMEQEKRAAQKNG